MTRLRIFVQRHKTALLWCIIGGGILLFILSTWTPIYFGWLRPQAGLAVAVIGNCGAQLWIRRLRRARRART